MVGWHPGGARISLGPLHHWQPPRHGAVLTAHCELDDPGDSILLQIPLLWADQKVAVAGFASVPVSGWVALIYLIVFATALGQEAWLYGVQ